MLAFIGNHFLYIPVIAGFVFTATLGSVGMADVWSHRGG
jgi:hypothetical protein